MGVDMTIVRARGVRVMLAPLTRAEYRAMRAWLEDASEHEQLCMYAQDMYVFDDEPPLPPEDCEPPLKRAKRSSPEERAAERAARRGAQLMSTNAEMPPHASILITPFNDGRSAILYYTRISSNTEVCGPSAQLFALPVSGGDVELAHDEDMLAVLAAAPPAVRAIVDKGIYDDWVLSFYC